MGSLRRIDERPLLQFQVKYVIVLQVILLKRACLSIFQVFLMRFCLERRHIGRETVVQKIRSIQSEYEFYLTLLSVGVSLRSYLN